jgi:hypothetical protein
MLVDETDRQICSGTLAYCSEQLLDDQTGPVGSVIAGLEERMYFLESDPPSRRTVRSRTKATPCFVSRRLPSLGSSRSRRA